MIPFPREKDVPVTCTSRPELAGSGDDGDEGDGCSPAGDGSKPSHAPHSRSIGKKAKKTDRSLYIVFSIGYWFVQRYNFRNTFIMVPPKICWTGKKKCTSVRHRRSRCPWKWDIGHDLGLFRFRCPCFGDIGNGASCRCRRGVRKRKGSAVRSLFSCPKRESNPHGFKGHWILSPARLPIPPSGLIGDCKGI